MIASVTLRRRRLTNLPRSIAFATYAVIVGVADGPGVGSTGCVLDEHCGTDSLHRLSVTPDVQELYAVKISEIDCWRDFSVRKGFLHRVNKFHEGRIHSRHRSNTVALIEKRRGQMFYPLLV